MTSLNIRCGVNPASLNHHHHRRRSSLRLGRDQIKTNPDRISMFNRRRGRRVSAVTTAVDSSVTVNSGSNHGGALLSERLDDWMRDSAVEIVKNLRQAPLFVQVFANNNGSAARLETEEAVAEDWPVVKRRWKDGKAPPPDGIILVEELAGGEEEDSGEEADGTKAFGIVVQGKGVECGPACYLLKTSRVGSGLGLGCTHFCLMKVQGFRESALSQLTNCWLLRILSRTRFLG